MLDKLHIIMCFGSLILCSAFKKINTTRTNQIIKKIKVEKKVSYFAWRRCTRTPTKGARMRLVDLLSPLDGLALPILNFLSRFRFSRLIMLVSLVLIRVYPLIGIIFKVLSI